jgi:hypothetical protein
MEIYSYPQVFRLGHKYIADLLDGPVVVQEKVDGSQFSFGMIDGKLVCRSKNATIDQDNPGMFKLGVETVQRLASRLPEGRVYRGEFLAKPKHNALAYNHVPIGNVILYDVMIGPEVYLDSVGLCREASHLNLEHVPFFFDEEGVTVEDLRPLLEKDSTLGGTKIEGVVIKNYAKFGPDKKVLMGKLVREDFQEVNRVEWKKANPHSGDIIERLVEIYATEARWEKARQHLCDAGELVNAPEDIGLLMREVPNDVQQEAEDEVKERLFTWAWPRIARGISKGIPAWYKQLLVEASCPEPGTTQDDGKNGSGIQLGGADNGNAQGKEDTGSAS